jgi:NAD(P)-dependent dehydrogenase (short-subunit alcohol dehydrogenase family)
MPRSLQQLFNLTGRNALITGGADGPGWQMARALGEAGARVMLCARQADVLEAACADLQADGIDARWVAADGAVDADLHKLVSETLQRMGDVDILVNSAGATWHTAAPDPLPSWDQVMALQLRGSFLLSQLIGKNSMIARGGCILNLLPRAGQLDQTLELACQTAQGAVIAFTETLAAQWRRHGITVNAVCLKTAVVPGQLPLASNTARRDLADGEDLKGITVLLASDAGKHLTGQCFTVDGDASAFLEVRS